MRTGFVLLLVLVIAFAICVRCDKDKKKDKKDLEDHLDRTSKLSVNRCSAGIPSGAQTMNNGYAYSTLCYTNTTLTIAGQNAYDSCGRLIPQDYDPATGKTLPITRAHRIFLNIKAIMQCFNMQIKDIPYINVKLSNFWNGTRMSPEERNAYNFDVRNVINQAQRLPEFWGTTGPVMARTIEEVEWLAGGSTLEIVPGVIQRVNTDLPTCLDTGRAPPAALEALRWDLQHGLGACSKPEPRNDDYALADVPKAPRFGDAGDLQQAQPINQAQMKTRCVVVPARSDSTQASIPAANLFVRTHGVRKAGQPVFVLIHGTSASHNYWRCVMDLLSRLYYVVAIDLRGHGQSQKTPATMPAGNGFKYTYEAFADDVYAILKSMNITENVAYGGISIGANIGIQLATKYPSLVSHLVLVNNSPVFRCQDGSICSNIVSQIASTPFTMFPEDVAAGCNVDTLRAKLNQNRLTPGVADTVASLSEYSQKTNMTLLLSSLKAPTMIVSGTADGTLPNGTAARFLKDNISNSVLVNFVNRGHLLPTTSYVDLSNYMLRFVQSNSFPEVSRVFDRGCSQLCPLVAPETDFAVCPNA